MATKHNESIVQLQGEFLENSRPTEVGMIILLATTPLLCAPLILYLTILCLLNFTITQK